MITFDDGTLAGTFSEVQGPGASVIATDEEARAGTHSMRATMTTPDRRSEIVNQYKRPPLGEVTWYGWSVLFPEGHPRDGRYDMFTQFHDYHRTQPEWSKVNRSPTALLLRETGLYMTLKFQSEPETIDFKGFELGEPLIGEWNDFVMQVNWTHEPDKGFLKLWINGELKIHYKGPTYMNYDAPDSGPYFKAGNYKGAGNWPGTSPRIIYIDEIRIGNKNATYEMVNPATYANEVDQN
ncbi:MAG: polysaccharide lyase [Verrucomicrobia bacterium]|nr:polysaccharide lyase [Verrucomicrobiota bacterium]MCH8527446.1 polysaccharide lyase [Kiritimatiellia bacterium]